MPRHGLVRGRLEAMAGMQPSKGSYRDKEAPSDADA